MKITSASTNIKIDGHIGKWHVIDTTINNTICCFLLEHSTYGDEAPSLIVDEDGKIIVDEIWNGFDDLLDVVYR